MLDSMTASASMNVLKKTEAAMENLRRLTDPLVCAKLSAPGGMQRNLLLTLYWLAEADMAGADVEQVLQEISRRGRDQATPADSTMAEVLLFNYHTARHLGVLSFSCLVQLGQGLPPSIPESDNNPDNRLAFAIPILIGKVVFVEILFVIAVARRLLGGAFAPFILKFAIAFVAAALAMIALPPTTLLALSLAGLAVP
jgi:hypothetical protein